MSPTIDNDIIPMAMIEIVAVMMMLEDGIVPISLDESRLDVSNRLKTLSEEDARRCRRKYRKIQRKMMNRSGAFVVKKEQLREKIFSRYIERARKYCVLKSQTGV